jgi:hypothetical protein
MARGPNKAPLCTNIEVLFVGMGFLRTTASTSVPTQSTRSGHSLRPKNAYTVLVVWRTAGPPVGVAASLRAARLGEGRSGGAFLRLTAPLGSPIC